MASSTKPDLSAVVTPALTDIVSVRQSGDTRDKRETLAQVKSLMPGGDVVGPASATDKAAARYSTTTGKLIQGSDLIIGDVAAASLPVSTTPGNALAVAATAPAAAAGASQVGKAVSLTASPAVASTDTAGAAGGGAVTITSGAAARNASGNANGGDINLVPGAGIGTGSPGQIVIPGTASLTPSIAISGAPTLGFGRTLGNGPGIMHSATIYTEARANGLAVRNSGDGAQGGIRAAFPSATVPSLCPDLIADPETGIGRAAAGQPSLIAGGQENVRGHTTGIAYRANIVSKTGAYTATPDDHTITCDTSGAGFTITLPALGAGLTGRIYVIKKISSDGNTLTIDGNAAETIDGTATKTTTTQYAVFVLQAGPTEWHVL